MSESPVEMAQSGFLGRWSRLKAESESPAVPVVDDSGSVAQVADAAATEVVEAVSAAPDGSSIAEPRALTDADMPDVDSLDEGSDFSGFLSEKISEQLRRKALNKLFHLPEFNIRDGLNEYDEDYSSFVPLGDTLTYQMKQFIERQAQQLKDALNDEGVESALTGTQEPEVDTEQRLPQTLADDPAESASSVAAGRADAEVPGRAE